MLLQNRYQYDPSTDLVAHGLNARLYKAIDTVTNNAVLVKFYHHLPTDADVFKGNMERLQQLSHPNLVQLHQYFEIENINPFGELNHIRVGIWENVPEQIWNAAEADREATEATVQGLLSAIQYLHDNGIVNNDIKYDNVSFAANGTAKLNNYGIAANTPDAPSDLQAFGTVLQQLFDQPTTDEALAATPVREVYGVLMQACINGDSELNSANDAINLLQTYDRQQRFKGVMPLSNEQLNSRYEFDTTADLVEDTEERQVLHAFDKLLDHHVSLELYKAADLALFNRIKKDTGYQHLFKLLTDDGAVVLAGIRGYAIEEDVDDADYLAEDMSGDTASKSTAVVHALIADKLEETTVAVEETITTTAETLTDGLDELQAVVSDESIIDAVEETADDALLEASSILEETAGAMETELEELGTSVVDSVTDIETELENIIEETLEIAKIEETPTTDKYLVEETLEIASMKQVAETPPQVTKDTESSPAELLMRTINTLQSHVEQEDEELANAITQTSNPDPDTTEEIHQEALASLQADLQQLGGDSDDVLSYDDNTPDFTTTESIRREALEEVIEDVQNPLDDPLGSQEVDRSSLPTEVIEAEAIAKVLRDLEKLNK